LAVHSVGETVAAGQSVARLYSPALYSAQEELLEAHRLNDSLLINAARQRLQHLKVGAGQIAAIESGGATATLPVEATYGGTVIEKRVAAGDYVEAGAPLFEVADLSNLWAVFEAYEGDLPHLRLGDEVRYTTPSLPGEHFLGRISYIAPLVDPLTRTTQVRLQMPNPNGRLRPGMYLVGEAGNSYEALSLPRSAVLWTGARSIIYVKADNGFHLREVELGAAIDDGYIILSGLSVGEEVVTRGAFLLDAAAQLGNLPSMMSSGTGNHPSTPQPSHHHHHH
jgi:Cu(I)/Ag(I) efflux system membrane fusion protein